MLNSRRLDFHVAHLMSVRGQTREMGRLRPSPPLPPPSHTQLTHSTLKYNIYGHAGHYD